MLYKYSQWLIYFSLENSIQIKTNEESERNIAMFSPNLFSFIQLKKTTTKKLNIVPSSTTYINTQFYVKTFYYQSRANELNKVKKKKKLKILIQKRRNESKL